MPSILSPVKVEDMEKETRTVIAKYSEIEDKLTAVSKEKTTLETKSTKLSTKLGGVLRELQVISKVVLNFNRLLPAYNSR